MNGNVRRALFRQQVFGDPGYAEPNPAAGDVAFVKQLIGADKGRRRRHFAVLLDQQVGGAVNLGFRTQGKLSS